MELLGTHDTGELALQAVHLPLPDVLLIDAHLAGISGMECVALLKQRHPELLVILLTAAENTEELFQCLRVGACGYLTKGLPSAALLTAIRHLYFGGLPMSAGMARQALQFFQQSAPPAPGIEFSRREREVLAMLAQGLRYKEIAVRLSVGVATVRTYLERAYGKLGVTNRTEAVARFMQHPADWRQA